MKRLKKEDITRLILSEVTLEVKKEDESGIDIYDSEDDRFIRFKFPEKLNLEKVFKFNSLRVEKEKFLNIVAECLDLDMFMIVDKVVFINNQTEYDAIIEEYPEQYFDLKNHVGIYYFSDNVILINTWLIRKMVQEDKEELNDITGFSRGIWETLIHELRHSITENPIYPEELIPLTEGSEEKVEEYCRKIYWEMIAGRKDFLCFKE